MSQSPLTAAQDRSTQLGSYRDGWRRLVDRISSGESFSGRERHCFFLNLGGAAGGKRFADLSAVSGIDFPEDARGIAITDWDHDGDLDLWISNRTSPAVRFLRNNAGDNRPSLQLRLVGTRCNRDAIGARVEVTLASNPPTVLLQTVRAGETYLSQSSRELHFGLGTEAEIASVTVRWPGQDEPEVVTGITDGGRFRIIQDTATAEAIALPCADLTLPGIAGPQAADDSPVRLAASTRPLFPPIRLTVPGSGLEPAMSPGRPTLVNLWASWCLDCVDELAEWTAHADDFREAGLAVVLVNADELGGSGADPDGAAAAIRTGDVPFRWGTADRREIEFLHEVLTSLTPGYRRPPVVPCTCLLDAQGQIAVVYRGPVSVPQILADAALLSLTPNEFRQHLTPFPGRWSHPPLPSGSLRTASALREVGLNALTERYLRHVLDVPRTDGTFALADADRAEAAFALGSLLAAAGRWQESLPINLAATTLAPRDSRPHVNLGAAHSQLGNWQNAIDHYSSALNLDPSKTHVLANRARAYLQLQQVDAALADFDAALALNPDDDQIRSQSAMIHFQRGDDRKALAHFRDLLARHPDSPDLVGPIAWILATASDDTLRNGPEAERLATRWCQATKNADPNALNTLAAAQAELGNFSAAAETVTRALALARQHGLTALIGPLEQRKALYESGKPFRR